MASLDGFIQFGAKPAKWLLSTFIIQHFLQLSNFYSTEDTAPHFFIVCLWTCVFHEPGTVRSQLLPLWFSDLISQLLEPVVDPWLDREICYNLIPVPESYTGPRLSFPLSVSDTNALLAAFKDQQVQ